MKLIEIRGAYLSATKRSAAGFVERMREEQLISWIKQITQNGSCITIVELTDV